MFDVHPSAQKLRVVVAVSALAALAYLPAQFLPLISDDYLHIAVARRLGAPSEWSQLARDPLYRFRAPSIVLGWALDAVFGPSAIVYNLTSLFFHILCVCLVAALGFWKPIGWRVSLPAAAFFAVAEGHQEAVVWFAAIPELHVFLFVVAGFLCWTRWLDTSAAGWYAASLAAFLLGLLSKESAVGLIPLLCLALWTAGRRSARAWLPVVPFAALGALYFALIYSTRASHQHFHDGTFALGPHFGQVLLLSLGRMLWIWGFLALALLLWLRRRAAWPLIGIAIFWAAATLVPYSFLTYMPRVPSRHTYLASAGLALLAGAALTAVWESRWNRARAAAAVLAATMGLHNIGYLWWHKHPQYVRRAEPTEQLIRFAQSTSGDIVIECFPYSASIAASAVDVGARQPDRTIHVKPRPNCTEDYRFRSARQPSSQAVKPSAGTT